ncbi:MAG: Gfo/Idh/MocA family protein, partial [Planctomycetota bacterium]
VAAAAAAGKGILCEKPLAMSAEQAEQMKRICDQAGVKLYTAFDYRFSPVAQTIHRLINEGAIGRVGCLRLIYIWNLHGRYIFENGRKIPQPRRVGRMEEGGPMVDCGVHQIDLARWWTGSEVTAINAAGAWVEHFHAPDHVWLHMEHENAAHTTVEMSFSYCADVAEPIARFSYELIGTDGLIRYDKREEVFEIRTAEGTRQLEFGHEKNFRGMYEAFAVALETGQDAALPTAHDGAEAVRISREATEMVIASRRR